MRQMSNGCTEWMPPSRATPPRRGLTADLGSRFLCDGDQGMPGMVYVVRAVLKEGRARFTAELETRQAAIRSAKELREQGFEVTITGPDGKIVDETEDG
jgi:Uncharacterized protein conserved in bacteria (DUF2188)